jgi:ABC-type uncharacterized transport system substrate-binding protein
MISFFDEPTKTASHVVRDRIPVASLNRPGGNATGAHVLTIDLDGKRLELLSWLVPASAPIGVLINPHGEYAESQAKEVQAGATRIGRKIVILNASSERDINSAFRTFRRKQRCCPNAQQFANGDPRA